MASAAAEPATQGPLERTLTGTVIGNGTAVAYLSDSTGQSESVHPGDVVEGWRVDSIEPRQIVLSRRNAAGGPDEKITLSLRDTVPRVEPGPTAEQLRNQAILAHQDRDPDALRRE